MTYNARGALSIYTKVLAWGGSALLIALLWSDRRWMEQPWITLFMLGAVIALRRGQIPLSKFSYLTQVGVVVLVGAVTVGPGPVAFALGVGIFTCDAFLLRKMLMASWINAGREVIGFVAGVWGLRLRLPFHISERCQPRVPPVGRDTRGDVLLLHPGTLLLHSAGSRQARGPRGPHDPAVRDPRVPADPDRGGGIGWRHHGAAARRVDHRPRRTGRPRAPHQAHPGRSDRRRGAQQDRAARADHHQQPHLGRRLHPTREAREPGARLGDFRIYRLREEQPVLVYRGALGWEGREILPSTAPRCGRLRFGPASRSWWWTHDGTSGSWRPVPPR